MRDALTIVNERMASLKTGTEVATPDERIDQKELIRRLSPQLFDDAVSYKQELGFCRVLNVRPCTKPEGMKTSAESDRRYDEVMMARYIEAEKAK